MRSIRVRISWPWQTVVGQPIQQSLLRRDRVTAPPRFLPLIAAVRAKGPCIPIVGQVGLEALVDDAGLKLAVEHRESDFDAPEQIAAHPVGAGEKNIFIAVVLEVPHAVMLEEPAQYGAHANVLRHTLDAWPQGTRSAHHHID